MIENSIIQNRHKMRPILICALIISDLLISCNNDNNDGNENPIGETQKDIEFTGYFQRESGWIAGDGAASIDLKNGNSLWTFGDSHIDDYNASTQTVWCLFQVRNAGLTMGNSNPENQQTYTGTGSPASLFQVGTNNEYWFWPNGGYTQNDTCYVFQNRIRSTGEGGSFGFESVDSLYVSKIFVPTMEVKGYAALGSKDDISFSLGPVADGGFQYIYGDRDNGLGRDIFVARFPENNLYADWEYYNGSGWTTDINQAEKIHSEFTASFSFAKIEDKYLMVTTEFSVGCDQGNKIYIQTSSVPYGPFENKKMIWTLDDQLEEHDPFFYLANIHPQYSSSEKGLLITYCINGYGDCVETCIDNRLNPDYYRPKAIRVPYDNF